MLVIWYNRNPKGKPILSLCRLMGVLYQRLLKTLKNTDVLKITDPVLSHSVQREIRWSFCFGNLTDLQLYPTPTERLGVEGCVCVWVWPLERCKMTRSDLIESDDFYVLLWNSSQNATNVTRLIYNFLNIFTVWATI